MLKLIIIGAILVAGVYFAYPYFTKIFPSTDIAVNAITGDIGNFKKDTIHQVGGTIDQTVQKTSDTIDQTVNNMGNRLEKITSKSGDLNTIKQIEKTIISPAGQQTYYGQVYEKDENKQTCKISVPGMATIVNGKKELTHTIDLENCKLPNQAPVQVTTGSSQDISAINTSQSNTAIVESIPQSKVFETLKLKTIRHDDNTISIQYEDTSGKTTKVTVTLRNSEKQLFSGEFFSSKFDTNVNDISASPHIIEMVVEHPDYGTVSSSVYNPEGNQDTTIYGVFTQPPK